ncbi:MAG: ABC transporter permease [candidate division Zixibacteria bacterium]|nr:ABC transporter permease [candidate division Zixibacteria bacterium]
MLLSPVEMKNAVMMALGSLMSNKFRSFLTILGVVVGVGSVISMSAVIDGLDAAAKDEVDKMGTNIITVRKFASGTDWDNLTDEERKRPEMSVGEAEAILANCPTIDGVAPRNHYFAPGGNQAKYRNRAYKDPLVMGTWPDYLKVREKNMETGRFFSEIDLQYRLMVCVLGSSVAELLFPNQNPVGREIRVNGDKFQVIGVMEHVKSNFGEDSDNTYVIMPLTTFQKLMPMDKALTLECRSRSFEEIDKAIEEVTVALRVYRKVPFNKENNFALSTQEQFKDEINNITNIIYMGMVVITSVGLMVGGIGVMNIMLVSVTERTREIGVRKAIGAKRSNIIMQFLTEAMTLSGTGGIIGVLTGLALGMAFNFWMGWPLAVSPFWIILGFTVSVSVGLVSGIYPAIKASKLDPIESLRYE